MRIVYIVFSQILLSPNTKCKRLNFFSNFTKNNICVETSKHEEVFNYTNSLRGESCLWISIVQDPKYIDEEVIFLNKYHKLSFQFTQYFSCTIHISTWNYFLLTNQGWNLPCNHQKPSKPSAKVIVVRVSMCNFGTKFVLKNVWCKGGIRDWGKNKYQEHECIAKTREHTHSCA